MKLTKPQWELLREVAAGGNAVEEYHPARRLVELGLCVRDRGLLELTDAGRDLLTKKDGRKA